MTPDQAAQVVHDADTLVVVACLAGVLLVLMVAAIAARVLMH